LVRSAVADSKDIEVIEERVSRLRDCAAKHAVPSGEHQHIKSLQLSVALSLLADLVAQGWTVDCENDDIVIQAPSFEPAEGESIDHAKRRIRKGLQVASNRQLAEPSVRDFLKSMERERFIDGKKVSIATLIDDGFELAKKFRGMNSVSEDHRMVNLEKVVRPVIEECSADARCSETGLKLQDIWRYFRYTWSLEYNPLPGRTQRFLIRNAARKSRPVIGIAMLASPTANLGSRDEWIGWRLDRLTTALLEGRVEAHIVAKKLVEALRQSVSEIRSDDLISQDEQENPDFNTVFRLERIAAQSAAQRKVDLIGEAASETIDIRDVDKSNLSDNDWFKLSDTALFKKKRSEQLIPLLRAIDTLKHFGVDKEPATAIYKAMVDETGQAAVRTALNEIKKRHLAAEIADLAVCGAITPYNKILGGKLVALLMASREVRKFYHRRYSKQVSEIASQIAGRAMKRSADLRLITTTSLYGVGSNQYTRLSLRRQRFPELVNDVVWKKLRNGHGVSITHIGDETVAHMRSLGLAVHGHRRINSVFGEGSSPRMRQVKEGLNLIGINDDSLLKQSHGRKVYGCELYEGALDDVLGFSKKSQRKTSASVRQISRAWIARWLDDRVRRPKVLDDLAASGSDDIFSELSKRVSEGLHPLPHPSENGGDARESVNSISSANVDNDETVVASTDRMSDSTALNC